MAKISEHTINLIGIEKYNLTPIKLIRNSRGQTCFLCRCTCGNLKQVQVGHFKSGSTKSCGCKGKLKDLTNQKFGTLKALKRAPNKGKETYWKCKCDCGLIRDVSAARLVGGIKSCGCLHPHRRKRVDDFYFKNINLESLYWAGFIAADGSIRDNNLRIVLKRDDKKHLQNFKKHIKYEGSVRDIESKLNNKVFKQSLISITSEQIIKDLKRYNIAQNKSLSLYPPLHIKLSILEKSAFMKGYIDGDGCIYIDKRRKNPHQLHITGTYNFLNWSKRIIEEILNKSIKNKIRHSKPNSKSYQFMISGKKAKLILDYLNNLETPYLKRKWNKLERIRNG